MITVYLIDGAGVYAGSREVSRHAALPRCTLTAPPATTGTEVAQWDGAAWAVLAERPPVPAPTRASPVVPMPAFVFALDDAGTQETAVDAVIAALPAGKPKRRIKVWWAKSTEIRRQSPQLAALAALMAWTDAQLDALFIAAQAADL